jgi:hypothetical protein
MYLSFALEWFTDRFNFLYHQSPGFDRRYPLHQQQVRTFRRFVMSRRFHVVLSVPQALARLDTVAYIRLLEREVSRLRAERSNSCRSLEADISSSHRQHTRHSKSLGSAKVLTESSFSSPLAGNHQ